MEVPSDLLYTKTHEWVKKDGNKARVGITEYAQSELSDVVYVELPSVGDEMTAGGKGCVVESVKAASDVYSPVSGKIASVNADLENDAGLVNREPYAGGWFFEVELSKPDELEGLLKPEAYQTLLKEGQCK